MEGAKGECGSRGQARTIVEWKRQRKRRGKQRREVFREADSVGEGQTGREMEYKGISTFKE